MKKRGYHFVFEYKGRKRDIQQLSKALWIDQEHAELIIDTIIYSFLGYTKKLRKLVNNDKGSIFLKEHLDMNLYSKVLEDIFGFYKVKYTDIMDALLDSNLLRKIRGYFYDRNKKYGICNRYKLNVRTIWIKGKRRNKYIDKLHRNAKKEKSQISQQIIEHQCDTFNDPDSFISIPADMMEQLSEKQKDIVREINECEYTPEDFKEKQGRIYHKFQQLPKWVRRYMVIEGQQAVSLDLKNSQGTVLGWIVEDYYKNTLGIPVPDDVVRWCELAETGILWEYIRDLLNLPDRERAKIMFNVAVFGRIKESEEGNLTDFGRYLRAHLKKKFPGIFHWVDTIKKRGSHKDVHGILTRTESAYIREIKQFMIDHDIPFTGIHDEIQTLPQFEGVIRELMESYGFAVNEAKIKYRPEDWHSDLSVDLDRERRIKLAERLEEIRRKKEERKRLAAEAKAEVPKTILRLFGENVEEKLAA